MGADQRDNLSSLQLVVLTSSDSYLKQFGQVKAAAFKDSPVPAAILPFENKSEVELYYEERERFVLLNRSKVLVVIVDSSQPNPRVAAQARWNIPATIAGKTERAALTSVSIDLSGAEIKNPPLPAGSNLALHAHFSHEIDAKRQIHSNPESDYILDSLATHPEYAGRGCASMLLRWGIEQAEAHGARIYLESTPVAHKLYLKHGWIDTGELSINLAEYGGDETYTMKTMIRMPQSVM